jgi:hypothetical protein
LCSAREEGVVGVLQWAEIRRMVLVEGRSQREVARVTGLARDTVAKGGRQRPAAAVLAGAGGVEAGSVQGVDL